MSINTEDADDSPRLGPVVLVSVHGGPSAAIVVPGDEAPARAALPPAAEMDPLSSCSSLGGKSGDALPGSTWNRAEANV